MTAPDPLNSWLERLYDAQPAQHGQRLTALEAQVTTDVVALAALAQKINNLEVRMSAADDKVAELTANLDNVSGDVQWLKDEAERLQNEIEAQDPALAAKLQPLVDRTKALADSVPDRPAPNPGGGEEPAPNPNPNPNPPTPGEPVEPAPGDDPVPAPVDDQGNPV